MIRLIAFSVLALVVTTSAQATPVAPVRQPDSIITPVMAGCGVGRTHELMVSACPDTKNVKPAGVCGGMEAIA
jgi:hypothetical protein